MKYKTQTGRSGIFTVTQLVVTLALAASCTSNDPDADGSIDEVDSLTVRAKQCRDGIDNDGDGRIDYPADRGCGSRNDNSENSDAPPSEPVPPDPTLAVPTVPAGFSAAAGDAKVTLTWNANSSTQQVDSYQIYRNGT